MSASRAVSLNHCALMPTRPKGERHLEVPARLDKGTRRRRSLRRGVDRWYADTYARVTTRHNVMLLALTFASDDPLDAVGAIRWFWEQYRRDFGTRPYFSWAELQTRGAVHYHAILVDPPWALVRHARRWIGRHWPHARIQPSVESRPWDWFVKNQGWYAKKYASDKWTPREHQELEKPESGGAERSPLSMSQEVPELHDKSYQQEYDLLPRELRTWQCSRLVAPVAEIDKHLTRYHIRDIRRVCRNDEWFLRIHVGALVKHLVPRGGWCTLRAIRKPLRRSIYGVAFGEDSGAHDTRSSLRDRSPAGRA